MVNYTSTDTQLLQFDVPNLDPYELVEVSVSTSNKAGEGPRSLRVRGRTREERKFSYCTLGMQVGAYATILIFMCSPRHCEQLPIKMEQFG